MVPTGVYALLTGVPVFFQFRPDNQKSVFSVDHVTLLPRFRTETISLLFRAPH